ncbi:MAG: hypothetical protein K6G52_03540 [Treponemataceae bacterium]|nr:hypothetical protein [Treponemataceae bacterium]
MKKKILELFFVILSLVCFAQEIDIQNVAIKTEVPEFVGLDSNKYSYIGTLVEKAFVDNSIKYLKLRNIKNHYYTSFEAEYFMKFQICYENSLYLIKCQLMDSSGNSLFECESKCVKTIPEIYENKGACDDLVFQLADKFQISNSDTYVVKQNVENKFSSEEFNNKETSKISSEKEVSVNEISAKSSKKEASKKLKKYKSSEKYYTAYISPKKIKSGEDLKDGWLHIYYRAETFSSYEIKIKDEWIKLHSENDSEVIEILPNKDYSCCTEDFIMKLIELKELKYGSLDNKIDLHNIIIERYGGSNSVYYLGDIGDEYNQDTIENIESEIAQIKQKNAEEKRKKEEKQARNEATIKEITKDFIYHGKEEEDRNCKLLENGALEEGHAYYIPFLQLQSGYGGSIAKIVYLFSESKPIYINYISEKVKVEVIEAGIADVFGQPVEIPITVVVTRGKGITNTPVILGVLE